MFSQLRRKPSNRAVLRDSETRGAIATTCQRYSTRGRVLRSGRKTYADELPASALRVVAQRGVLPVRCGDSRRALVGQMQNRRQPNAAGRVESAQQRARLSFGLKSSTIGSGGSASDQTRNQGQAVGIEIDRPAGGREASTPLADDIRRWWRRAARRSAAATRRRPEAQCPTAEPSTSQAVKRQIDELRPRQRDGRVQKPAGGVVGRAAAGDRRDAFVGDFPCSIPRQAPSAAGLSSPQPPLQTSLSLI